MKGLRHHEQKDRETVKQECLSHKHVDNDERTLRRYEVRTNELHSSCDKDDTINVLLVTPRLNHPMNGQ